MTSKKDIKKTVYDVYDAVISVQIPKAIALMDTIEKDITMYYNTRGLDCDIFYPLLSRTRNFLKRYRNTRLHKKKLYKYLFELNKLLKITKIETGKQDIADAKNMLKVLYDDLIDDYSDFTVVPGKDHLEKNRNVLDMIRNDLLEIRDLKYLFIEGQDDEHVKSTFLILLKAINECLVILPQLNDVSFSAGTIKLFRESFSRIFNIITEILDPVEEKTIEIPLEIQKQQLQQTMNTPVYEPTQEPERMPNDETEKKTLGKMTKELGINLKEMERKAKLGLTKGVETKDDDNDGGDNEPEL